MLGYSVRVTSGLTFQEFALFKEKLIEVEEAFEPGCSKLNWNALGFNTFVHSARCAIDSFEKSVLEVRRISKSIKELTETISELNFSLRPTQTRQKVILGCCQN